MSRYLWLVMLALLLATSAGAADDGPHHQPAASDTVVIVGINRTNLAWEPAEVRKSTLEAIRGAGVRVVRLTWRDPAAAMLDVLDHAAAHDIAVLIEIPISERVVREGAVRRPGNGRLGPRYRLSDLDLQRYQRLLEDIAAAIAARPLRVVALQLGNEINWADFNGDLPLLEPGRGFERIEDLPTSHKEAFESGLRLYTRALRALQLFRDRTPALAGIPIVTAGLTTLTDAIPASGGSMVAREATFQRLDALGGLMAVDGVALHIYRPFRDAKRLPTDSAPMLAAELALCGTRTTAYKPCWITEFGSSLPSGSCPADDSRRARQIDVFFDAAIQAGAHSVAGAFYYDWDQGRSWAVFRCGQITEAGRTLIHWSDRLGSR